MGPGDESPLFIQSPGNSMAVSGSIGIVPDIFLPCPEDLDGLVCGLGEFHRLLQEVGLEAAAESSPQVGCVDLDLLRIQSGNLGCLF